MRADDHAIIGTVLMAILAPAVLWNRAHVLHRAFTLRFSLHIHTPSISVVLGGAGFGSSTGLLTYYGRSLTNTGNPSHKSNIPVPSAS